MDALTRASRVERALRTRPAITCDQYGTRYPYMRCRTGAMTRLSYFKRRWRWRGTPARSLYMERLCGKSQYEEAAREHRRAIEASGESAMLLSALGFSYARSGKVSEARVVLEKMKESARRGYVSPYSFATIYAGLGNGSEAHKWLQKAFEDRDYQLATPRTTCTRESSKRPLLQRILHIGSLDAV